MLKGKNVLITGVANQMSIAAACVSAVKADGGVPIVTHHPDFERHAHRFLDSAGVDPSLIFAVDALDWASVEACFGAIQDRCGVIHGFVDCIAYSDPELMKLPLIEAIDSPQFDEAFDMTMRISTRNFIKMSNCARKLMRKGGSIVTMTYNASQMAVIDYGLMTGAKGANESYMRLLALAFGPLGIRVNAVSASPLRTPSGLAVPGAYPIGAFEESMTPLGRRATHVEVAMEIVHLLSDRSSGITGQVQFVNCGRNAVGKPLDRYRGQAMKGLGFADKDLTALGVEIPKRTHY